MTSLKPGSVLFGKLAVVRALGSGAMGEVVEVEHQLTLHRSALKVLIPEVAQDKASRERFFREASAAGRIGNPHIVQTFDAGLLDDGRPYLLMEKLEGQSLDALLRRTGALTPGAAAYLAQQVFRGLAAAHASGIIHRDVKPANLFVTTRDGLPFIKVLDFGLSRFDSPAPGAQQMTRTGMTLGTPLYMPPEQMRSARVNDRADVYSAGVVLFECLAGSNRSGVGLRARSVRATSGG